MLLRIDPTIDETIRSCQALNTAVVGKQGSATAIVVAIYALIGIGTAQFARETAPATLALAIGGLVLTVLATQWDGQRRLRRIYEADPHVSESHFVEVTDRGVRTWCDHVESTMRWDALTAVTETTEFYLFLRGPGAGPAIPKRLLDRTGDAELRGLIRAHSPDQGRGIAERPDEAPAAIAT